MITPTDFLLARIDEDTAWVTEHVASHGCEIYDAFSVSPTDCGEMTVGFKRWQTECEAKRRIVEQASFWERQPVGRTLDYVARLLALPYADHPDYREEWRA